MNTVTSGTRVTQAHKDPEDIRVGETLQALMFRNEETPEGYIIRRKITHDDLAKNIVLNGRRGVSRTYITQLCTGAKHMNNELLYSIARYLGVNPVAIKRPDMDRELVAA